MAVQKLIYDPYEGQASEQIKILEKRTLFDKNENVEYILFKLEKKLGNGSIVQFYKASRFFRLVRVSKVDKENKKFMEIHTDIIRAMYHTNSTIIHVIGNVLKPEPVGLIYLAGVQSTGNTPEEAIRKCGEDFAVYLRSFQGTHRTNHIIGVSKEEVDWIFKKIQEQKYVLNVKGIPQAKVSSGQPQKNNVINAESSSEEQMEQFLTGMATEEFVFMMMATPINKDYLRHWLTKSLNEQTKWESQKQGTNSISMGISIPMSFGMNNGTSTGSSVNNGRSSGSSISENQNESFGKNNSSSSGTSWGTNENNSDGTSWGTSNNQGTSWGSNEGGNHSDNRSTSIGGNGSVFGWVGVNVGSSGGSSDGTSWGTSEGGNSSFGTNSGGNSSHSTGTSEGGNTSVTEGTSETTSKGFSTSENIGSNTSNGSTVGRSSGSSMSAGLSPSLSIGKTYQWQDMTVAYICELLTMQNSRLKSMTDGDGGFFVDVYISCDNNETQKAIEGLVASTWVNPDGKIDLVHGEIPQPAIQKKLSLHMQALSPCLEVQYNKNKGYYYKFSSILRSSEVAAYTHPPRVSIGGLDNAMDDRPKFRIPNDRQNKEIFVGHVISGERFSYDQALKHRGLGYLTDFKFSIGGNELHHAFISGQAGSGKSVLARRLISQLFANTYTTNKLTGKKQKKRVLILDPKGEWRLMGNVIEEGKFKFHSVADPNFHPLPMNLLRCPKYIRPYEYLTMVTEHFCPAYGLLDRAVAQIRGVIFDLYTEVGAFQEANEEYDPCKAYERTKNITLEDVCNCLKKQLEDAEKSNQRNQIDALQTYLTRLDMFSKPHSTEYIMFCKRGGDSIDSLLGDDEVTVIESNGLPKAAQSFFFVLLMDGIFRYAQGVKGFYREGQYETFIVLEEANTVLIASSSGGSSDGNNEGNNSLQRVSEVIDQSRSYGLFIWTITQKIASMPNSVVANSGLTFIGRSTSEKDIGVALTSLGYDSKLKDLDVRRFIPRMPIGEFIISIKKGEHEVEQVPTLVKVSPLDVDIPSDEELELIIQRNELAKIRQKNNN